MGRFLLGHLRRCKRSVEHVADQCVPTKDQPRSFLRLLEQGQKVSLLLRSAGVMSSVSSSDLDAHSFVPTKSSALKHCLDGLNNGLLGVARSTSLLASGCFPLGFTSSVVRWACPVGAGELVVAFAVAGCRLLGKRTRCCRCASRNAAEMSRVRSVIDWRSRQHPLSVLMPRVGLQV